MEGCFDFMLLGVGLCFMATGIGVIVTLVMMVKDYYASK